MRNQQVTNYRYLLVESIACIRTCTHFFAPPRHIVQFCRMETGTDLFAISRQASHITTDMLLFFFYSGHLIRSNDARASLCAYVCVCVLLCGRSVCGVTEKSHPFFCTPNLFGYHRVNKEIDWTKGDHTCTVNGRYRFICVQSVSAPLTATAHRF